MILARTRREVGGLGELQPAGAVLGRQAERVAGVADQPALGAAGRVVAPALAVAVEQGQGHHLVDDAGQLAADLPALELRLPGLAVHLVDHALEDADEDHRPAGRVLQVLEQPDHLAGEQAVGAAHVRLAGLVAERLGPGLGPGHRLPGQVGDAVDEHDLLAGEQADQVRIELADMGVVAGREEPGRIGRRARAADQAGEVDRVGEAADRDAVARPALQRLHPGLEVDDHRVRRRQPVRQRGLAHAGGPEDRERGLAGGLGQALVGADEAQAAGGRCLHQRASTAGAAGRAIRVAPRTPSARA